MNHANCSAERVETDARGAGRVVFMCVFHLFAGVAAALLAFGALALFST